MKNPCSDCIVRANCTQVCWAKNNNKTLLNNGIEQCMIGSGRRRRINPTASIQYHKTNVLYNECLRDIERIKQRAREAKGDTMSMGATASSSN